MSATPDKHASLVLREAEFTRTSLRLDSQGWAELSKATQDWLRETATIELGARERLGADPQSPIDVGLVISLSDGRSEISN